MELRGIKAIVTGGASGLGAACARNFARKGAEVFVADVDPDAGAKIASEPGIIFVETDVSDRDETRTLFDRVRNDEDPARVLVNCAGISPRLRLVRNGAPHCLDAFHHILKTNVIGTFLPITLFVKHLSDAVLIGEEKGVIINVSSITSFDGQAGQTAYAASKGAINAMTLPLARELANEYIRAVTVAPGVFDTPALRDVSHKEELGTQVPHPSRLGSAEEFASLARHIVENPMMNGEVIRLDGALRMTPS